MKTLKTILGVFTLITLSAFAFHTCKKATFETQTMKQDQTHALVQESIDGQNVIEINFDLNWEDGTYLVFQDLNEFAQAYSYLKSVEEVTSEEFPQGGTDQPLLDQWENQRNFFSMRRTYFVNEELALQAGVDPKDIPDLPFLDDAIATILSVDCIVQIGDTIHYISPVINARAPIQQKERLKQIIRGSAPTPQDIENGIEFTEHGLLNDCFADFEVSVDHETRTVVVTYTGTSIWGGDRNIEWSGAGGLHTNEEHFTHTYSTPGEKEICVTFSEYDIIKVEKVRYYPKDTTIEVTDSIDASGNVYTKDTIVTIWKREIYEVDQKVLICFDKQCKTIDIGGCNPDFSYTIGNDNRVYFVNKSSVKEGKITQYHWDFGDGTSSNEPNPTHTYDCNRTYIVTLTIYSTQCPEGYKSFSREVKARSAACCDRNPKMGWKEAYSDDYSKKIKYKYDMGAWCNDPPYNCCVPCDQDFKAKIKFYKKKKVFWRKDSIYRKAKGELDVNFEGKVFAKDKDGCFCQEPRVLEATPAKKTAKKWTFRDNLSFPGTGTNKLHWMKDNSPVYIDYIVDGYLYVRVQCQNYPGFHCE